MPGDKVVTTLYMPRELYAKLENYMTQRVGSQYGKNGVVLLALKEFLDRHDNRTRVATTTQDPGQ